MVGNCNDKYTNDINDTMINGGDGDEDDDDDDDDVYDDDEAKKIVTVVMKMTVRLVFYFLT